MEILDENNAHLWTDFEKNCENLPPQYFLGWKKSIESSYKNSSAIYYFEKEGGKITSLFPFFTVKSKLFGNRIISLPFIDFGGVFGKPDKQFISEVIDDLKKKFKDNNEIEVRVNDFSEDYSEISKILEELGFKKESKKNQVILKLESEDSLWNKFDRLTKKGIKKAEKSQLKLADINNPAELDNFYRLYLKRMKGFGTPQHSYSFFSNLLKEFEGGFRGLNCYKEKKLIASLLVFYSKDYMYAAYNFSEPDSLVFQPNDLLHWDMIKWAVRRGIKYFDIGQCDSNALQGTHAGGIFRFKSKWGAHIYNKFYFYLDLSGKSREKLEGSENGGRKMAVKIWRKLPPFLIKRIGPKIASELAL